MVSGFAKLIPLICYICRPQSYSEQLCRPVQIESARGLGAGGSVAKLSMPCLAPGAFPQPPARTKPVANGIHLDCGLMLAQMVAPGPGEQPSLWNSRRSCRGARPARLVNTQTAERVEALCRAWNDQMRGRGLIQRRWGSTT